MSLDLQFNSVNDKLQQLLKQYKRLQKDNERLNEQLKEVKLKEKARETQVQELHQQVAILKMAAGEMTDKDKKEFERRLNQYIKDVDRCINLLSQ
jgi:chromosome segregation ATPase